MASLGACDVEWRPDAGRPPCPPRGRGRRRGRRRGTVLAAIAVVLAVAGVVLIGWALAHQVAAPVAVPSGVVGPSPPGTPSPIPAAGAPVPPAVPGSPPARVVAPTIGVDSAVSSVGLNPDRTMEVPAKGPGYDLAAWYRYSVTPGQQGPSVIIGHVDSRENGPSVFYDLGRIRPGAPVEVTRADGRRVVYDVYAVRSVAKDAFPTQQVYGATVGPELRLITCGGSFDEAARNYLSNTVVFARER